MDQRRHRAGRGIAWSPLIAGNGASLLYLLSALSLLFGLTRIIGPVLAQSFDPAKLFPSLGVLYVYELSLLGAAVLIVRWRNVTDDAISLLVLMAVFLGVGGLALETVAHDSLPLALAFGLTLVVLGGGKLWAIRRWLAPGMGKVVTGVIVLVLAYGYLAPVGFAKLNSRVDGIGLRTGWLAGWWILVIAGTILYVAAGLCPSGDAWRCGAAVREPDGGDASPVPFARTRGMGWIFVAVLLVTAVGHQLAVAHVFDRGANSAGFPWSWPDLLPFASLALLLAVQYRRVFGCVWGRWDELLVLLPAFGIAVGLGAGWFGGGPGFNVQVLWHPAVLSALIAVAMACKAYRLKRNIPWAITILYASLAVLSLDPPAGGGVAKPFWLLSVLLFAGGLVLMAVVTRRVGWAVAAAVAVGGGVFASPVVQTAARTYAIHPWALALVTEAITLWVVYLVFPRTFPRVLARLAPVLFLLGTIWLFGEKSLALEVVVGVGPAVLMGAGVWWRSRDRVAAALYAGAPVWQGWRIIRANFGWGCVLLAFLLLAGVAFSLRKGARARAGY